MKLQGIITATIAVIMIMLIAVPLIDDASSTVRTSENNTTEKFMVSDENATVIIKPDDAGTTYTVNGVPFAQTYKQIYLATDDLIVYFGNVGTSIMNLMIMHPEGNIGATTIIVSDGVLKGYNSSDVEVFTAPINGKMYYLSESGTYGLFTPTNNNPLYINSDSNIIGLGNGVMSYNGSTEDTLPIRVYIKGSGPSVSAVLVSPTNGSNAYPANTVTVSPLSNTLMDDDTYRITSATSDVTITSENKEYSGKISFFLFAPIEYKFISENDGIIITLLELVPVLLIVALVLGIGYEIAYKRE